MGAIKIGKAISDSYGKYFIEVQVDSAKHYTVWGADSSDDDQDKLLIGANNEVLLFQTIQELLQYTLTTSDPIFDEKNIKEWTRAHFHQDETLSYVYNLDYLEDIIHADQFFDLPNSKRKDCLYALDFINLISDYAYQINDKHLLELYKTENVRAFLDFISDNYFWTIDKEELAIRQDFILWKDNYLRFKMVTLDLLNSFKSRLLIYKMSRN